MTNSPYKENSVLIIDDEPEYLDWLHDYLNSKGLSVEIAESVGDAVRLANAATYRLYLVDLNIPAGNWVNPKGAPELYSQYKGFHVIRYVRNQTQSGRRVIAYSAHENVDIHAAVKNLYCQYVVKGRARDIKMEIEAVLEHDPRK